MTPTILGRWQTRILLLGTLGIFITFWFALFLRNFITPFALLIYVILFGLGWDVIYNMLQSLRWDRDWPPIYFLFGAIVEAVFLWGLIQGIMVWHPFGLPTLPGVTPRLLLVQFVSHYSAVWLITFMVMLGPLKVAFLQWRFKGGRWLGRL